MASKITSATMTVTITEKIVLNGRDQGGFNSISLASINEISKRIQTVPTSEVLILTFGVAPNFVVADVRYIRITNLDDTNYVTLNIEGANSTDFSVRLDPSSSFVIAVGTTGLVDYADISGASLEDLTGIKATANSAACDLEVFVASA